jgi:GDP-mannose transporter
MAHQVLSSLIAAWSDISNALGSLSDMATKAELDTVSGVEIPVAGSTTRLADIAGAMSQLNSGYLWMIINCMASAGYVLAMRKRIKVTNFKVGCLRSCICICI